MELVLRVSGCAALCFLTAAGHARGDIVSPDVASYRVDSESRHAVPATAEQPPAFMSLSLPHLLANALKSREAPGAGAEERAAHVSQLTEVIAQLNNNDFVWLALVESRRSSDMLFADMKPERPWGTEGLPGRLAKAGEVGRPSLSGAPIRVAQDADMLHMEHQEPWSRTAAAFYRGLIAVTAAAIIAVFWLRDQMKNQPRQLA